MNSKPNNSQQSHSSSNDSILSHASGWKATPKSPLHPVSPDQNARETTPSTSLSNSSSQDRAGSISSLHEVGISQSPTLEPNIANTSSYSLLENQMSRPMSVQSHLRNGTHAPKRTANGEVKSSGQSQQSSPDGTSQYSHSRHTSTASRSSHISDMSNDLCARLSYAVFKVQKGLQSHSLDQVEAMALQRTTPPTGTSQRQPAIYSPSSTFRATNSPYSPEKTNSMKQSSPDGLRPAYHPQQPYNSFRPPSSQDSGLDRTSWQSTASTVTFENAPSQRSPYRGPTLAPPADILPRNSRRPRPNNLQQPQLDTRGLHGNGINGMLSPMDTSITPSTPPRRPTSNTRTPNPKSAEEQDAVETLMFMSSPGNSGYHPAFHAPMSPPPPKYSNTNNPRQHISSARLSSTADIDRVLDQMPDHDSSSDEDIPFAQTSSS
ncbi:MAG: hypothetical protein Q9171_006639 [Xanthocarpia ochracea]